MFEEEIPVYKSQRMAKHNYSAASYHTNVPMCQMASVYGFGTVQQVSETIF